METLYLSRWFYLVKKSKSIYIFFVWFKDIAKSIGMFLQKQNSCENTFLIRAAYISFDSL